MRPKHGLVSPCYVGFAVSESARELGKQVVDACLAMGFALAGIAPAEPTARRREYLEWLGAGRHGDMGYLAEMLEERLDVRVLLPGARAVIVVADQYAGKGDGGRERRGGGVEEWRGEAEGVIAKYARGRDYHAVVKRRLHALCDRLRKLHSKAKFRAFTDTGPVMEREHAVRAGIGFVGKHTLVIHPRVGSYLLLGGVATTLDIGAWEESRARERGRGAEISAGFASEPAHPGRADHCGTCTLCIDACPTQAIEPYTVDATKCVSYLTLEHRGTIDPALHAGIGDRLIGCDVCQDVCPFNRAHEGAGLGGERVNAAYADGTGVRARLPILDVLGWREEDRSRVLGPSAAKRASMAMLRRNALVIAGNAMLRREDAGLRAAVGRIAGDAGEDLMVRETARQVLGRTGE